MTQSRTHAATEAAALKLWERDLELYFAAGEVSPSMLGNREKVLRRYVQWVRGQGVRTPKSVRSNHVQAFAVALRDGGTGRAYASATATQMLGAVRAWHRFLSRERGYPDLVLDLEPVARVSAVPTARATLSQGEVEALRSVELPATPDGWRDGALLHLLCATGARPCELVALRPFDLNARRGTLRLGAGSKHARVVPLDAPARAALQHYARKARPALLRDAATVQPRRGRPFKNEALLPAQRSGAFLFVGRGGRGLPPSHLTTLVQRAAVKAELPAWVRPSTVRSSVAVHHLQDGESAQAMRRRMGASEQSLAAPARSASDPLRRIARLHPRA